MYKKLVLNLIPDSLKNSPMFNDVLSILAEYIMENSPEAIDILNVYDEDSASYPELVKMYAHNFIDILERAKNNTHLQDKLIEVCKKYGEEYDVTKLNIELKKLLNRNNLELLKNFYQTKGTLNSFRYVYDIFNKLQLEGSTLASESVFDVAESGEILTYDLKTNMQMELYEQFVKPLVHPLGWSYIYTRLVQNTFNDFMFVSEVYEVSTFNVDNTRDDSITDNYKINRGHLFETNVDGTARLKNGFPITYAARHAKVYQVMRFGKYYDELDLDSEICLVQDPTVVNIEKGENGQTGDGWIKITFASGEYLEQHSIDPELGTRTLRLYYGDGPNNLKQIIKKDYSPYIGEYGLDIQYKVVRKVQIDEDMVIASFMGFFDTPGTKMFCGCGNALVSKYNICGTNEISNKADSNILTRVKSISLNPKYKHTRQSFLGFKYKYPNLFLYINLENFNEAEFPLLVSCEGSNLTIPEKNAKKAILQYDGIKLNERFTLEQGYTDKEYTVQIYSNEEILEECNFRLVPNIDAYKKEVELVDFDFEYDPENGRYMREATMQYFTDIVPPAHIDSNADTYELTWDHLEYYYYANIGSLSQVPPSTFIKEIDVFDYKYPKYFSNLIGHFKLYDYVISYDAQKGRLVGSYPHGSICQDDFNIEIIPKVRN